MTKINVSELEGAALDWAAAQIDPMCNGLTWEVVPGGRVGFAVISGEKTPCAFLSHGSCLSERMRLKRDGVQAYSPSTDWSQGGPLIADFGVSLVSAGNCGDFVDFKGWGATTDAVVLLVEAWGHPRVIQQEGPEPLIAAMRAIVAAEIGDTIDVPEELL